MQAEGLNADPASSEDPAVAPTAPASKRRRKPRPGEIRLVDRLEYGVLRALGFGFRHLPVGASSAVVGAVLEGVMPLTGRNKRALENLAYAMPELGEKERRYIARRMWNNLGRVVAEAFQIDKLIDDHARVTLPDDYAYFEKISKDGIIAATAHLGNWEISGALPRRSGVRFAGIYQSLHNPLAERYLKRMRSAAYPDGLYSKGPKLGHAMVRLAREGVGIGMVADFRELRGIPVRFFGRDATATPLPAMLARLSGRPLVAGAIVRDGGVHFRVVLRHIPMPVTDDRDADIAAATQAMHDAFEEWIRKNPEQWMWTHRKWARSRRQPAPAQLPRPADAPHHDQGG